MCDTQTVLVHGEHNIGERTGHRTSAQCCFKTRHFVVSKQIWGNKFLGEAEAVRTRASTLTNTFEVVIVQLQGNHPAFVVDFDTIPFREFRIGVPAVFSEPTSPAGCPKQRKQHCTIRRSSINGNLPGAKGGKQDNNDGAG